MITDEMLREAVCEAAVAFANSLPPEDQCEYEFSPRFHRRMARLIRRASHPHIYRALNRAAGFLLALLLTGTVWLSVDTRARDTFFGWLRQPYETFFAYRYAGERVEQTENRNYRPAVLPEDWVELDSWTDESGGTVVYTDGTGRINHFTYVTSLDTVLGVISDLMPIEVGVNGVCAEYYPADDENGSNSIVWSDAESGVLFTISGYLDMRELVRIAEGVEATK